MSQRLIGYLADLQKSSSFDLCRTGPKMECCVFSTGKEDRRLGGHHVGSTKLSLSLSALAQVWWVSRGSSQDVDRDNVGRQ